LRIVIWPEAPMANIPTYCAAKRGKEAPDYIHPRIAPILKETFGVIIYQEQVMQIAQVRAGFSLSEADLLRRAMGKKIKAERGLDKARADEIFDLLAKFAEYGLNKSHAAAYALIAYQTAWFKANYSIEFLASSMTLDKSNTEKLAEFCNEARRLKIAVLPPSVRTSNADFEPAEWHKETYADAFPWQRSFAMPWAIARPGRIASGTRFLTWCALSAAARAGPPFRRLFEHARRRR
jgi:DNA polymerase-3 subunit alpha